ANVLHKLSVDLRLDLPLKVLTICRLNVAGNFQRDARSLGNIDGNMSALKRRNSAYKAEEPLLLFHESILTHINAMMNRTHLWHRLLFALSFADANVMDIRI